MKVIRINAIIDKSYKRKLIDFEDKKIDYVNTYTCYDEVIINNKKIPVKINISPKEYKSYTHNHFYGERYIDVNVEIELEPDNILFFNDEISSSYDICYEGYVFKKEKDTVYVVKLSFDEVKDLKYMRNKMFYIKDMVEHKKNDNLIEGAFYTKSLTNKIEQIELVYLILTNKIYKGELCSFKIKNYLKEKFAFYGYDEDFMDLTFSSEKGLEDKLNYYISLIIKELYYHGKLFELDEDRYEIDDLYIDIIESIFV